MRPLETDDPLQSATDDFLGRSRIADLIWKLIAASDRETSIRIGLMAGWGEGKTTVARFVAERAGRSTAEAERPLVVDFNPWQESSVEGMFVGLLDALMKAIRNAGGDIENLKLSAKLSAYRHRDLVKAIADIVKAGRVTELIGSGIRLDRDDVVELLAVVPSRRRVLVVVDDLDRTDPALIPRMLLALRELLNVPGVAFLVPMDQSVVMQSLERHNTAWGDGERFLEKIFDYRFTLPQPTTWQATRLLAEAIRGVAPFVKQYDESVVIQLVPRNPRRIKALARSLAVLEGNARVYKDWTLVLVVSMLRLESDRFYLDCVRPALLADDLGAASDFEVRRSAATSDIRAHLTTQLAEATYIDQVVRDKLQRICDALLDEKVRHIDALEALRWVDQWTLPMLDDADFMLYAHKAANIDAIEWAQSAAENSGISEVGALAALADMLLQDYQQKLGSAALADLPVDHRKSIVRALRVLGFAEKLFGGETKKARVDRRWDRAFDRLLTIAVRHEGEKGSIGERTARRVEQRILERMVQNTVRRRSSSMYRSLAECVRSIDRDSRASALVDALIQGFCAQLPDPLNELRGAPFTDSSFRYLLPLLNVRSALWQVSGAPSPIETVLAKAAESAHIQRNALSLLRVLTVAAAGAEVLEKDLAMALLAEARAIGAVWRASVCRPLHYSRKNELEQISSKLVQLGVDAATLPRPPWMRPISVSG